MRKLLPAGIIAVMLLGIFSIQPALADTTEERIERLEKTVVKLQEALREAKKDIAKQKKALAKRKAARKGVVRTDSKKDITVSTKGGGLQVKSDDGSQFNLIGRFMLDYTSFDGAYSGDGNRQTESEWRRARLGVKGKANKDWAYKFTLNISDADSETDIDTAYIKYSGFKPLDIMVGKFKQPFGLEALTSSKWISAMEYSFISEVSLSTSKPDLGGIMFSGYHKDMHNLNWAIGVFDNDEEDSSGDDVYSYIGRLAISPEFSKDHFMHLGVAYSMRDLDGTRYRVRTRMGVHTVEDRNLMNSARGGGRLTLADCRNVDDVDELDLAAAYVRGPFSLQGEYYMAEADDGRGCVNSRNMITRMTMDDPPELIRGENGDIDTDTWYIQATYTLTGETRGYKMKGAKFDQLKPSGPFGAWELVWRYEDLEVDADYNPRDIEIEKYVIGLNWYVNKNVKFMANYIWTDTDHIVTPSGDDDGDAFTMRAQYSW